MNNKLLILTLIAVCIFTGSVLYLKSRKQKEHIVPDRVTVVVVKENKFVGDVIDAKSDLTAIQIFKKNFAPEQMIELKTFKDPKTGKMAFDISTVKSLDGKKLTTNVPSGRPLLWSDFIQAKDSSIKKEADSKEAEPIQSP